MVSLYRTVTYYDEELEELEEVPYVFLKSARFPFPDEDVDKLAWNIVDMERRGVKFRLVKADSYHAKVTRGEPTLLGYLYGVPFNAELDMESNNHDSMGIFLLKDAFPSYSKN